MTAESNTAMQAQEASKQHHSVPPPTLTIPLMPMSTSLDTGAPRSPAFADISAGFKSPMAAYFDGGMTPNDSNMLGCSASPFYLAAHVPPPSCQVVTTDGQWAGLLGQSDSWAYNNTWQVACSSYYDAQAIANQPYALSTEDFARVAASIDNQKCPSLEICHQAAGDAVEAPGSQSDAASSETIVPKMVFIDLSSLREKRR
eukprot:gnl/TRDRNA2_/TRDRNA2_84557_c0_seq1.p1 gnl/TRDRNA2_/TRDRNA2_84557_c0~~gnl/TRDRNA2_/TRDRNA2_84557_c0_seq1.p1  ORF type:complete len:201 (+),score=35.61 gnl/TRDRNA2_/TRDRNA2_84557_c0_seq1:50-652(+)